MFKQIKLFLESLYRQYLHLVVRITYQYPFFYQFPMTLRLYFLILITLCFAGCATVTTPPTKVDSGVSRMEQADQQKAVQTMPQKVLKRKIAVGRFTNETRYGRTLQVDERHNPLGKQASDIMASRLIETNQFLILERSDMDIVLEEKALVQDKKDLIGADTLIVGAITEFGRNTKGVRGFLSSTKVQTAEAKVEIRLVDVTTGRAFFSASGVGSASTESGDVLGYGSRADYDGTLNDRAISAAISDVLGKMLTKLNEQSWRASILKVDGDQVFIAAGERQGVKIGDQFQVFRSGEQIKNPSTGFMIDLPPQLVGRLQVTGLFGDSDTNEGAVATLMSGTIPENAVVFVAEPMEKKQ